MTTYKKAEENKDGTLYSGQVIPWANGVVFKCPCVERDVYVASPPHEISFDNEGRLTLDGSVGSREDKSRNRATNWCHFWIKNGIAKIAEDSQCPGKQRG